ncbi:MAG: hypothetical protein CMF49_06380 [Legionellales bacterium]|nr:hypothetical protein [Legionellales bacterium]|tara:strand:+ start:41 stop:508 length:468 start_codon:yes stop_codon:yes gene_type:complete
MNKIKHSILVILLSLIYFSSVATAQIYKSTDASGNVTYSDKPSGNQTEIINITPSIPSDNSQVNQRNQALIEKQNNANKAQKQAETQSALNKEKLEREKQIKQVCKTSRDNLKLLQVNGRRVYTVKPNGDYHYLSEDERMQEITRLESQIKKYCE